MQQRVALICCLQLIAALAFAQPIFQKMFHNPGNSLGGSDAIVTSDNHILAAGAYGNLGVTAGEAMLLKTDLGGNIVWMKTYSFGSQGSLNGVVELNGAYYAAGFMSSGSSGSFCMLLKTDTAGNLIWTKRIEYEAYTLFQNICATPDGHLLVGGMTFDQAASYSFLVKADTTGAVLWQKTYSHDPSLDFDLRDLTVNDSGKIFITGTAENSSGSEAESFITGLDATGGVIWSRRIAMNGEDFAFSKLLAAPDNGCYVAGRSGTFDYGISIALIDSAGNVEWSKEYGVNSGDLDVNNISYDVDGDIVLAGSYFSSGGNASADILLVKTDDGGALLASNIITTGDDEDARAIVPFTDDGRLLVVGTAELAVGDALHITLAGSNMQAPCNNQSGNVFATNVTLITGFLTLTVNNGGNVTDETAGSPVLNISDSVVCGDTAQLPIGVDEVAVMGFSLYPNPASFEFNVQSLMFNVGDELRIFDVFGKEVYQTQLSGSTLNVQLQLENGMYFVRVKSQDESVTRKLMIQH